MPKLDWTLVKTNLKKEILNSTIDGIDKELQLAIETDLQSAKTAGKLDVALFGPALTALNKTLTDICYTYNNISFKNIPDHITALIQEMINSNSKFVSRLEYVYFTTAQDETEATIAWEPEYTGTAQYADLSDDDWSDDELKVMSPGQDAQNEFVVVPLHTIAENDPFSPAPLERNLSETSNDTLSASALSLSQSQDLLRLSQQLSETEQQLKSSDEALSKSLHDLRSSNESLSKSQEEYQQLHTQTHARVHHLLAMRTLDRLNKPALKTAKHEVIRREREAAINHSSVNLSQILNRRIDKHNDISAHHHKVSALQHDVAERQKKIAALRQETNALAEKIMVMSCPPAFFAGNPAATIDMNMNQSIILPPRQQL